MKVKFTCGRYKVPQPSFSYQYERYENGRRWSVYIFGYVVYFYFGWRK